MRKEIPIQRLKAIQKTLTHIDGLTTSLSSPPQVNYSALSPIPFLRRAALIYPHRLAVEYESFKYDYSSLSNRVLKFATILKQHYQIQKGDRIAFICRNVPILYEAHFAVPALGAIIVAINTRLNKDEVEYIIGHCKPKLIIYEEDLKYLVENLDFKEAQKILSGEFNPQNNFNLQNSVLKEAHSKSEIIPKTFEVLIEEQNNYLTWDELPYLKNEEDDIIAICYTSGTTGRPKGVMTTYRSVTLAALNNCLEMGFTKESKYLWTLPLFHCNGWCFPWAVVAVGASSLLIKKVEVSLVWKLFLECNVTHYCAAPTVQISLVHAPEAQRLQKPITAMVAGSPPTPALIKNMTKLNLHFIHSYGLTETLGPCTISYTDTVHDSLEESEQHRRLARQGFSYVIQDPVRVVDENMNDVPKDGETLGEVVFRGNMVMKGYYNDPEATSKAFQGGYFHTGDIAVVEHDGSITLKDRSKDIIISGGENISSIEIEKVLAHHQAILEVAVTASPHPKWGETPKAFIVLKDDFVASEMLQDEINRYCRANLAGFKCPGKIEFVDALPKTGTGKVQKYILKKREFAKDGKTNLIN